MSDIKIEGEVSRSNIAEFERKLRSVQVEHGRAVALDLSGLDIEDSFALSAVINGLRDLCNRAGGLVLVGAPQMLGHNLYRVGLLGGPCAIKLVDMRQDEPAVS
jgi:anti-anti-sigma regulatory factor